MAGTLSDAEADKLEDFVTKTSLSEVLMTLALIADGNADYIGRENSAHAARWADAARKCAGLSKRFDSLEAP